MPHVFFDLDGTLTDPAEGIVLSLQHALAGMGAAPRAADELRRFIGPPLRDAFRSLLGTDAREPIERAIGLYRERFSVRGLYENAVYPGIPELLAELRADGLELWVVTSKPTVFADRIVDHFGLRARFNRVHGSELSGERSDKGELIAHVLRQEGIGPHEACMIGDRKHDVAGAGVNGLVALGVLWGYGSRDELEAAGARELIERPQEVAGALRRLQGPSRRA